MIGPNLGARSPLLRHHRNGPDGLLRQTLTHIIYLISHMKSVTQCCEVMTVAEFYLFIFLSFCLNIKVVLWGSLILEIAVEWVLFHASLSAAASGLQWVRPIYQPEKQLMRRVFVVGTFCTHDAPYRPTGQKPISTMWVIQMLVRFLYYYYYAF